MGAQMGGASMGARRERRAHGRPALRGKCAHAIGKATVERMITDTRSRVAGTTDRGRGRRRPAGRAAPAKKPVGHPSLADSLRAWRWRKAFRARRRVGRRGESLGKVMGSESPCQHADAAEIAAKYGQPCAGGLLVEAGLRGRRTDVPPPGREPLQGEGREVRRSSTTVVRCSPHTSPRRVGRASVTRRQLGRADRVSSHGWASSCRPTASSSPPPRRLQRGRRGTLQRRGRRPDPRPQRRRRADENGAPISPSANQWIPAETKQTGPKGDIGDGRRASST